MFRYREEGLANRVIEKLKVLNLDLRLMHVCGTHQDTMVKFGLNSMLQEAGIEVRAGPGCPVCVTTTKEIEEAILLARKGKVVATFGDMFRVPGPQLPHRSSQILRRRISLSSLRTDSSHLRWKR